MSLDEFDELLNTKKKKKEHIVFAITYCNIYCITCDNFLFVYGKRGKKIERKTNKDKTHCNIRKS